MKQFNATLFPPKPNAQAGKSCSWWLDPDRFYPQAKIEQPRMSHSKFANISTFAGYEGDQVIAARVVGKRR